MEIQFRSALRGQLTKKVNDANDYLSNLSSSTDSRDIKLETLNTHLQRIQNVHESLKAADLSIRAEVEEKNYASECSTILEYNEKAITAIARILYRISVVQQIPTEGGVSHSSAQMNQSASNSLTTSVIKLPRLELKKFNGNYNKWLPFWEQYKTAVHLNNALDDCTKFNFLQSVLTGRAADTIAGLTPTEACYSEAIEMLKDEYGSSDRIVDKYMQQLMSIKAVKSRYDAGGLRNLYSSITSAMRSLNSLKVTSSQYNMMLKSIILKALPNDLRVEYYRIEAQIGNRNAASASETNDNGGLQHTTLLDISTHTIACDPTIKRILNFIKVEAESLEKATVTLSNASERRSAPNLRHTATGLFTVSQNSKTCLFCQSPAHTTTNCDSTNTTIAERKEKLKAAGRCFRCTHPTHSSRYCKNKYVRCKKCNGRHATAMCDPNNVSKMSNGTAKTQISVENVNNTCEITKNNAVSLLSPINEQVFLQTGYGIVNNLVIRFILYSASTRTYIRENVARKLNLPVVGVVALNIIPFGCQKIPPKTVYNCVEIKLRDQYSDNCVTLTAVEVPEICADVLPVFNARFSEIVHLPLADARPKNFDVIPGMSLLIGGDYYQSILVGETRKITQCLAAVNTKFGWTLHGPASAQMMSKSNNEEMVMFVNSFEFNLENFWKLESIGIHNEKQATNNDFLHKFLEESIKTNNKRYEISLPWITENSKIDDNFTGASARLRSLTQRLARIESKLIEYDDAMQELLSSGITEVASETSSDRTYYLPHRAVYQNDKTTSRVRIVFDASSHAPGETSLNDHLHQGPNLLPDLLAVLLDFRSGQIGVVADIERAFMQICISIKDRDSHRFLWYAKPLKAGSALPPVRAYRFTRVTFGVNCSPFLLNAVIKRHLYLSSNQFQVTKEILSRHLYVDDLVTSVDSPQAAEKLYREAKTIMAKASMNLRKWNSNHAGLRELFIAERDHENTLLIQKVLGCTWCTPTDDLKVDLSPTINFVTTLYTATKRIILQTMARVYDPLGLLGPFIIRMKMLMQTIWKLKPEWDEVVPDEISMNWKQWCLELEDLNNFYVPRCVFNISTSNEDDIQLHLFCDASPKAYGVAAFVRRKNGNGEISTNILCAKHRVAPLNKDNTDELSLPKLELTAALLASRLKSFICNKTSFKFNSVWFWSDSKITLCWIKGDPRRWKQFICNRVSEIKLHSTDNAWHYCPGKENPADLLTRGVSAKALMKSEAWKFGPPWLSQLDTVWPMENQFEDTSSVNISLSDNILKQTQNMLEIENFSSYTKLLRVTAYVFQFITNAKRKNTKIKGNLTASELQTAENYLVSIEQQRYFSNEISTLTRGNGVDRLSKILKLCPQLDCLGILRLGGRLHEINDETNLAHPIILPKESHLSLLYVRYAHTETLHGGINVALTFVRKRYWILRARQLVKSVINKCVTCKRLFSKPASQPFAPIPRDRLNSARVFETTGVDFAGPKRAPNYRKCI